MSAGNSAYSPLPQSNSDSDGSSEEELHISQENRIVNRGAKVQNSMGEKALKEQKNNIINYKPLDNDGDGVALNKFQLNLDEVSILKPDGSLEIFSTSRKICFVFSLLLCVFTTVAFIWILPCNVGSCPNASDMKNSNFTWEKNLPDLEIYGPINLITDQKGNQNLLFLTRSPLEHEGKFAENDLQCLKGKDGYFSWRIKLNEETTDIDCNLTDINVDGINDCLIFGKNFLKAINPLSGKDLWNIQDANKRESKLYFRDFPLVIPDLDEDQVKELLLTCSFDTVDKESREGVGFQNYLVVISGKTGIIINKPFQIKPCSAIHNLIFENSSILSYSCFYSNEKVSFQNMSFTKVYNTLKNPPKEKISIYKWEMLSQHKRDTNTVRVKGFRLTLKNQGNCPEDCDVSVVVKDERESSNNKTIFSFIQKNTFGMAPVVFKTTKENGFVLKFWKWHSKTENSNFQNDAGFSAKKAIAIKNNNDNLRKKSKTLSYLRNNSKYLDNEMLLESEWEFQRMKRTAVSLHKNNFGKKVLNPGDLNLHVISETISKISFNNSHLIISNVTKDEIIQICKKPRICQPNVHQQRHSVLIAHNDADGRNKLITFTSEYVHEKKESKKNSEAWKLQSRIRVLNL